MSYPLSMASHPNSQVLRCFLFCRPPEDTTRWWECQAHDVQSSLWLDCQILPNMKWQSSWRITVNDTFIYSDTAEQLKWRKLGQSKEYRFKVKPCKVSPASDSATSDIALRSMAFDQMKPRPSQTKLLTWKESRDPRYLPNLWEVTNLSMTYPKTMQHELEVKCEGTRSKRWNSS